MSSFPHALALLDRTPAEALARCPILVGLDGFVDTITHVVAQRQTVDAYTRLTGVGEFAERVARAAGCSTNFEFVTRMVKLGGNGPILANALGGFGVPVTYVGNLGVPSIDPVFEDFAACCERVISLAAPARTEAIEFEDGKLMCGKNDALGEVNWDNILRHILLDDLRAVFARSSLVALVNWTMVLHLTDILRAVVREIVPTLPPGANGAGRWLFFDLADPAKRTREDIAALLQLTSQLQAHFQVVLGLNYREASQVGDVLGLAAPGEAPDQVADFAAAIRDHLQLETVVVHPIRFAVAANGDGRAYAAGSYTPHPLITTGAGDHFNAGFCLGLLLGASLEESLSLGVGTSGFYVRNARSPSLRELRDFLEAY